jgi:hypothetical protein
MLIIINSKDYFFWDMTLHSFVDHYQSFRGDFAFIFVVENGDSRFLWKTFLMIYQTAQCHIPGGSNLHCCCRENLRSHSVSYLILADDRIQTEIKVCLWLKPWFSQVWKFLIHEHKEKLRCTPYENYGYDGSSLSRTCCALVMITDNGFLPRIVIYGLCQLLLCTHSTLRVWLLFLSVSQ